LFLPVPSNNYLLNQLSWVQQVTYILACNLPISNNVNMAETPNFSVGHRIGMI
jgi:uncharacterized protein YebE (UPF0316 family)